MLGLRPREALAVEDDLLFLRGLWLLPVASGRHARDVSVGATLVRQVFCQAGKMQRETAIPCQVVWPKPKEDSPKVRSVCLESSTTPSVGKLKLTSSTSMCGLRVAR